MDTDVIIIGQGIAGLVLSAQLQQRGIHHVVLGSYAHRQNDIALAETLPPTALPLLDKLGMLALFSDTAIQKTYGYHSFWGTKTVSDYNFYFHSPYKYGLKINKQAILRHLENQQEKYMIHYEKALGLQLAGKENQVTVVQNGATKNIRGKLIIDATGRKRVVLNKLNIPSVDYDTLMAFSCHVPRVKHPALTHDTYIESFKSGWGIVSGLNADQNVYTLYTRKEDCLQLQLQQYETWAAVLNETKYLRYFLTGTAGTKVKGRRANSSKAAFLSGEGWLAVGDAALSFDPLSSHGITNALYTVDKAATAIQLFINDADGTELTAYDKTLTAIFMHYLKSRAQLYSNECRWPEASFWYNQQFSGFTI